MRINQKLNGIVIGGIFTLISLILTLTFIVPFLTLLPATFLEYIVSIFVNNKPYSNVGKVTTFILFSMITISFIIIIVKSRKIQFRNKDIVVIMLVEYFLMHSFGFYIYWGSSLNYRSDGQLIFGVLESFPFSSFGFIALGILIDLVKLNSEPEY